MLIKSDANASSVRMKLTEWQCKRVVKWSAVTHLRSAGVAIRPMS